MEPSKKQIDTAKTVTKRLFRTQLTPAPRSSCLPRQAVFTFGLSRFLDFLSLRFQHSCFASLKTRKLSSSTSHAAVEYVVEQHGNTLTCC